MYALELEIETLVKLRRFLANANVGLHLDKTLYSAVYRPLLEEEKAFQRDCEARAREHEACAADFLAMAGGNFTGDTA